jgi:hypothetical protein
LAWDKSELIADTLPEFDALSFYAKNNAFYIHCMDCKKEPVRKKTSVGKTALKRKRPQEDDDDVLEISPIQWHNRDRKI